MANEQLLLLDNHVEWLSQKFDDLVKSKNVFVEALDKPAAKLVLNYLNRLASPHIPDSYKPDVQEALTAAFDAQYGDAVGDAIDVLDAIVDEAGKLTPTAKEIITSLLALVKAALQELLTKKPV
jgi:hypothetical protein